MPVLDFKKVLDLPVLDLKRVLDLHLGRGWVGGVGKAGGVGGVVVGGLEGGGDLLGLFFF